MKSTQPQTTSRTALRVANYAWIAALGFTVAGCTALTDMSDLTFASSGGTGGGDLCTAGRPPGDVKIAFVTSIAFQGDLANLDGADPFEGAAARCTSLAHEACLGGEWKAWFSAGGKKPSANFGSGAAPYVNMQNTQIAASLTALYTGGELTGPIDRDEHGLRPAGSQVWTGTSGYGDSVTPHCAAGSEWQSKSETDQGLAGQIGETGPTWSNWGPITCNQELHLYCFEQ